MAKTLLESVTSVLLDETRGGDRVTETIIAEKLGLSRTPVREVLHQLKEEGLIKRRQRSGISITQFSHQDVSEVFDIRAVMEGLACSLLALRINKSILQKLQNNDRKLMELLSDNRLDERRDKDFQFHQLIVQNCGNRRLVKLTDTFNLIAATFLLPLQILGKERYGEVGRREETRKHTHSQVIAALKSYNSVKAEKAMRLHILEGKEAILRSLRIRQQSGFG